MNATALIRLAPLEPLAPWPRHALDPDSWAALIDVLATDPEPTLVALWADQARIHALFHTADDVLPVATPLSAGAYLALSSARPEASPFERAVADLWGHRALAALDDRPLLDHGRWPTIAPLSARPVPNAAEPAPPDFLPPADDHAHQITDGPARPLAAPRHRRITLRGEHIERLEHRLGYAHRGILGLMRGKTARAAARYVARLAADSTVAHATAYAAAAEAAAGIEPPPRALALRTVMGALERIATRLDALAASPGDPPLRAVAATAREHARAAAQASFGHRLMMDCVVPGGVAVDCAAPLPLDAIAAILPKLHAAHEHRDAIAAALTDLGTDLPDGKLATNLPPASGEGIGVAQGPRGDVWHWLRLEGGLIGASFVRDPTWLAWPRLEHAAIGRDAVPPCFPCNVPGGDL